MAQVQQIGNTPRAATLNERLNKTLDRIDSCSGQIEDALGRVNGTPAGPTTGQPTAPTPMRNLALVVEQFESLADRLRNLAEGVDKIA